VGGELKGRGKTIFYASLKNKEKFLNPLTPTLSHGMGRGSHWCQSSTMYAKRHNANVMPLCSLCLRVRSF